MLLLLVIVMLVGSYLAGSIPLVVSLSEVIQSCDSIDQRH